MNFIHILDGQGHHISHLEHKQNALADSILPFGGLKPETSDVAGGGVMLQPPYSFLTVRFFFHFAMLLYHFTSLSPTSLSPCCSLMPPLSLTHFDSFSHEPSFLVLLPLVRAHYLYLFKNIVTACISLT